MILLNQINKKDKPFRFILFFCFVEKSSSNYPYLKIYNIYHGKLLFNNSISDIVKMFKFAATL